MSHEVSAIVMWCRQAYSQNLLTGDICKCRQIAAEISRRYDLAVKRHDMKQLSSKIDDVFETWLMLEHPNAYEAHECNKNNMPTIKNDSDIDENGYIMSQSIADLISAIRSSGI